MKLGRVWCACSLIYVFVKNLLIFNFGFHFENVSIDPENLKTKRRKRSIVRGTILRVIQDRAQKTTTMTQTPKNTSVGNAAKERRSVYLQRRIRYCWHDPFSIILNSLYLESFCTITRVTFWLENILLWGLEIFATYFIIFFYIIISSST